MTGPFAAPPILESQQFADLAQRQAVELRLLDEPNAVQRARSRGDTAIRVLSMSSQAGSSSVATARLVG